MKPLGLSRKAKFPMRKIAVREVGSIFYASYNMRSSLIV